MDTDKFYVYSCLDDGSGSQDESRLPSSKETTMSGKERDTDFDNYDDLDDLYDAAPSKKGGQVNNRMGTLNRQAGIINRYRKNGLL